MTFAVESRKEEGRRPVVVGCRDGRVCKSRGMRIIGFLPPCVVISFQFPKTRAGEIFDLQPATHVVGWPSLLLFAPFPPRSPSVASLNVTRRHHVYTSYNRIYYIIYMHSAYPLPVRQVSPKHYPRNFAYSTGHKATLSPAITVYDIDIGRMRDCAYTFVYLRTRIESKYNSPRTTIANITEVVGNIFPFSALNQSVRYVFYHIAERTQTFRVGISMVINYT